MVGGRYDMMWRHLAIVISSYSNIIAHYSIVVFIFWKVVQNAY